MRGTKPTALEARRGQPLSESTRATRRAVKLGSPTLVAGREPPKMPAGLSPLMKGVWTDIVRDLTDAKMIDRADWAVLEAFAVAVGRARHARQVIADEGMFIETKANGLTSHPAIGIEERAWKEVRQLTDQLPFSPWGRARLGIQMAKSTDEVERVLGPARLKAVK